MKKQRRIYLIFWNTLGEEQETIILKPSKRNVHWRVSNGDQNLSLKEQLWTIFTQIIIHKSIFFPILAQSSVDFYQNWIMQNYNPVPWSSVRGSWANILVAAILSTEHLQQIRVINLVVAIFHYCFIPLVCLQYLWQPNIIRTLNKIGKQLCFICS